MGARRIRRRVPAPAFRRVLYAYPTPSQMASGSDPWIVGGRLLKRTATNPRPLPIARERVSTVTARGPQLPWCRVGRLRHLFFLSHPPPPCRAHSIRPFRPGWPPASSAVGEYSTRHQGFSVCQGPVWGLVRGVFGGPPVTCISRAEIRVSSTRSPARDCAGRYQRPLGSLTPHPVPFGKGPSQTL